jgi:hypothetical protein
LFFLLKVTFHAYWEHTYVLVILDGGLDEARIDDFLILAQRTVTSVAHLQRAD